MRICIPAFLLKLNILEAALLRARRYGLAWSPYLEGHLLSGSDDAQICLWDIRGASKAQRSLDALQIFQDHSGVVEARAPPSAPCANGCHGHIRASVWWGVYGPQPVKCSFA